MLHHRHRTIGTYATPKNKTHRSILGNPLGEENPAKLLQYRFINQVQFQCNALSKRNIPDNPSSQRETSLLYLHLVTRRYTKYYTNTYTKRYTKAQSKP